jgi:hypothetical protein
MRSINGRRRDGLVLLIHDRLRADVRGPYGESVMAKYTVVYTIEGAIEFDTPDAEEAMRRFGRLDQARLGELGELVVLTDPLEESEADSGSGVDYGQSAEMAGVANKE